MAFEPGFMEVLRDRKKKTRVYQQHQMTGLLLAEILEDNDHKSLYIRLAKTRDAHELMILAKRIAESTTIKNKGAYFMKVLHADKKTK